MEHYPEKSKTELRQLNKATYTWLYRNDKEWLNSNSPDKRHKYVNSRVDWNKRDKEIFTRVKSVVEKMLKYRRKA